MFKQGKKLVFLISTFFLWGIPEAQSAIKTIVLDINTARTLQLDTHTTELFIANPAIADVQLSSPKAIYVYGKTPGITSLMATNSQGETTLNLQIKVQRNLGHAQQLISKNAGAENVDMVSGDSEVILSGEVENPEDANRIESIVKATTDSSTKIQNNLSVASPAQVYLKVKIAEVSRSVLNTLDINWGAAIHSPSHFAFGMLTGARAPVGSDGTFARASTTSNTNSLGLHFNDGHTDLGVLLDVLNKENLASLLAEPNLVALSGQTASFLVGGEVPILIPQGQNVSIEYKQVGISLSFTPTVLAPNRINLKVRPEVSEVDSTYSTQISAAGQAINVPGISTRRAETCVELASGQSLAIAGLFSRKLSNSMGGIPGLAELPVLGALFKSTAFNRNETELVIVVTPFTVQPTDAQAISLPTDTLYHASNLEMLLFNKLNRDDLSKAELADKFHLNGEAGFYIN